MEPQYRKGWNLWPGLKILDRYIIRKFLGTYLFSLAMIVVVVVVFDYVEKIDDFAATRAPRQEIINYYLNFVPFFVNQFSALFTFIACIFFTSKLAHRTEIVAMLSGLIVAYILFSQLKVVADFSQARPSLKYSTVADFVF